MTFTMSGSRNTKFKQKSLFNTASEQGGEKTQTGGLVHRHCDL